MRWMNRLANALIVLAVVTGPPLLAAAWLGRHPWRAPTRTRIDAWAEQPLTDGTIIAGCVMIAGLIWLLLLTYLVRRAVAELRRRLRRLRHLPVPTPAQMTAGSMAGLAAFALPTQPTTHPQPQPAATGTTQPSHPGAADPAASLPGADREVPAQPAGITLPGGGWIPYRTAAAISALATLTWVQTRRHYRPDPQHPRGHDSDPDLQPASDTVHTIATAITDDQATGHDRLPPLSWQHLPPGVLLLTGPGAAAAARALLVTAALTPHSAATSAVSLHPGDLHLLLPETTLPDEAITVLGADTHRPVDNPASATGPAGPDEVTADPIAAGENDPHAGTVITLGGHPGVTHRWHVTVDGGTTGTGLAQAHRLGTLDPQTTVDLLTLTSAPPAPTRQPPDPPQPHQRSVPAPDQATTGHLALLGGCHLSITGQPVHIRRTAGLQILAYLALHPHGATRSELTHALWPHLPAATISQRLHTTLTDLRGQLRPLLGADPVTRHDDRYQLNIQAITTDQQQWRTAVDAMTHAVGTTARHHACHDVARRYHGELAAGHTWAWIAAAREQTRRTAVDAFATLADNAEPDQALTYLQQAITIDPYNEHLHQQAADLLQATGDHTGATDLIDRLHHRLAGETRNAS